MKEIYSSERTPDVKDWNNILNAVIAAHKNFSDNHDDPEKLESFKAAWNTALEKAATTDEMEELAHHVPIDKIRDFHSSALEKMRAKWDVLSDKELADAHDLTALKHAYDNAPFDEHRAIALEKLVLAITEKDAHRFHDKYKGGSELALALENKFPELFSRVAKEQKNDVSKIDAEDDGGLYDNEEIKEKEEKKTSWLIRQIRKTLGLE